jgi:hypothetical protein
MQPLTQPVRSWGHGALRLYLCLFLVGCGAHRPPLSEVRDMETRVTLGDEVTAFQACVATLQDLGYTVEVADVDAGILTASRSTHERSGQITEEPADPNHKPMPAWQWAVLIVTGVIVIVAAVAILSHDDDQDTQKNKTGHDEQKPRHKHHEPPPPTSTFVAEAFGPDPPTTYAYRITINVRARTRRPRACGRASRAASSTATSWFARARSRIRGSSSASTSRSIAHCESSRSSSPPSERGTETRRASRR